MFKVGDKVIHKTSGFIGNSNVDKLLKENLNIVFTICEISRFTDKTMRIEYDDTKYIVFTNAFILAPPFQLEIGKKYRTRKGKTATVVAFSPSDSNIVIVEWDSGVVSKRRIDGNMVENDTTNNLSLIEEVKPERWIGLHYFGTKSIGIIYCRDNDANSFFTSEDEVKEYYNNNYLDRFIKAVRIE